MKKQKSLAQVAYEADPINLTPWDEDDRAIRLVYERIAQAVIRAAKRREKVK